MVISVSDLRLGRYRQRYAAVWSIGSISDGSLFLTLPTRPSRASTSPAAAPLFLGEQRHSVIRRAVDKVETRG